jgi:hypothetical protein
MKILAGILQILTAILYTASGVMKVFMFDKASEGVPSFGALPRKAWAALGVLELGCVVGLILPVILHRDPILASNAAAILALESLVFIWVHLKYREPGAIIFSAVLGAVMAFIAYENALLDFLMKLCC